MGRREGCRAVVMPIRRYCGERCSFSYSPINIEVDLESYAVLILLPVYAGLIHVHLRDVKTDPQDVAIFSVQ